VIDLIRARRFARYPSSARREECSDV